MKDFYDFCFHVYECAPIFPTLYGTTSHHAPRLSSILYHKDSDKLSVRFNIPGSELAEALCVFYLWFVVSGQDKIFQFFNLQGMQIWESSSRDTWVHFL